MSKILLAICLLLIAQACIAQVQPLWKCHPWIGNPGEFDIRNTGHYEKGLLRQLPTERRVTRV